MLLGNFDAKGGMIVASTYDYMGKGKLYDLAANPGKTTSFGISSIRHGLDYEKTTIFSGYPAKRNWYPLSSDIYEEIIPSIGDAYPYPVKALFLYMGAPTYSLPAGNTNIKILCDTDKSSPLCGERHPDRHDFDVRGLYFSRLVLSGTMGVPG